ncbi:MAG TPA: hypothetical protein VIM84_14010, partial [Gemmatimonadales bacterium]
MPEHVTLLHPDVGTPVPQGISPPLPADLLSQAASRLGVLALVYVCVFFLAGIFPALVLPTDRALFLSSFI